MTHDIVVQKYGGTSIADPDRVVGVANRIRGSLEQISRLVVVVSAMGDTTDQLSSLAREVSSNRFEYSNKVDRALLGKFTEMRGDNGKFSLLTAAPKPKAQDELVVTA